jgi:hypothetical protein
MFVSYLDLNVYLSSPYEEQRGSKYLLFLVVLLFVNRNANMVVIHEYMSLISGSKPERKRLIFR